MFPDPLLTRLTEIGFSWWELWVAAAFASITLTFVLQKLTKTNFDKDEPNERRLEMLYWPFLVLGPITAAYLIVAKMGEHIASGLLTVGYLYGDYALFSVDDRGLISLITIGSFIFTLALARRYVRLENPKWMTKRPVIAYTRGLLINLPMTVMTLSTFARLIDHWQVLYRFSLLGWKPEHYYNADGMYGLAWSNSAIVTESIVTFLLSLAPLIMLFRADQKKWTRSTLTLSVLGLAFLGSYFLVLIPSFNRLFAEINAYFLNGIIGSYSQFVDIASLDSMERIYQETILARRFDDVSKLPADFGIRLIRGLASLFTLEVASVAYKVAYSPDSKIETSKLKMWFQGILKRLA